uniref:Mitochondrial import inner membrane translocase subunit Tim21 n=1 Tax=Heterosigma akashiwo TaxID=2829 RepID=A0A7S3Y3Z6_HETAK
MQSAARTLGMKFFPPRHLSKSLATRAWSSLVCQPPKLQIQSTPRFRQALGGENGAVLASMMQPGRQKNEKICCSRGFATQGEKTTRDDNAKDSGNKQDEQGYEEDPGEKVSPLQMVVGFLLLGVVGACGYNIVKELFPGGMSPNAIFNASFESLQADAEVATLYGTPLKAYGEGGSEGRRNLIQHTEYKGADGSDRVRVRFHLEGPYRRGLVFAEVSSGLGPGEYVYLMVQDLRSGAVHVLQDNRARLAAASSQAAVATGKASAGSSGDGGFSSALDRLRSGGN